MAFTTNEFRAALGDGLLSFPVTDFDARGDFSPRTYRERVGWLISHGASAVFAAGGTGEFFSLSMAEYRQVVETAVDAAAGRVPVVASAGCSIPAARQYVSIARQAGCDGILLMPPYLTECPEQGVAAYAEAVIGEADLPFIYYNRANGVMGAAVFMELARRCDNLVALKDGVGNIAALNDTIKTVGDRVVYIGGVPTAEIIAEAYLSIGVNTYSSAVFNFVPGLAGAFYRALRGGDRDTVGRIIRDFFAPFCRLRDRRKGYAVSLIKTGARLVGRDAGDVRPPLVMPTGDERASLRTLIDMHAEAEKAI